MALGKKLWFGVIPAVLVLGYLGSTYVVGNQLEDEIKKLETTYSKADINIVKYEKGFFSSDLEYEVENGTAGKVLFKGKVDHGPLPLSNLVSFNWLPLAGKFTGDFHSNNGLFQDQTQDQIAGKIRVNIGFDQRLFGEVDLDKFVFAHGSSQFQNLKTVNFDVKDDSWKIEIPSGSLHHYASVYDFTGLKMKMDDRLEDFYFTADQMSAKDIPFVYKDFNFEVKNRKVKASDLVIYLPLDEDNPIEISRVDAKISYDMYDQKTNKLALKVEAEANLNTDGAKAEVFRIADSANLEAKLELEDANNHKATLKAQANIDTSIFSFKEAPDLPNKFRLNLEINKDLAKTILVSSMPLIVDKVGADRVYKELVTDMRYAMPGVELYKVKGDDLLLDLKYNNSNQRVTLNGSNQPLSLEDLAVIGFGYSLQYQKLALEAFKN